MLVLRGFLCNCSPGSQISSVIFKTAKLLRVKEDRSFSSDILQWASCCRRGFMGELKHYVVCNATEQISPACVLQDRSINLLK